MNLLGYSKKASKVWWGISWSVLATDAVLVLLMPLEFKMPFAVMGTITVIGMVARNYVEKMIGKK